MTHTLSKGRQASSKARCILKTFASSKPTNANFEVFKVSPSSNRAYLNLLAAVISALVTSLWGMVEVYDLKNHAKLYKAMCLNLQQL